MPTLPANSSNTFPKKIHFAVIGQLTPADVRNIIIWKKYNPDYEVTLHRDPHSYLDQLKLQKMSEVALRIDELVRINKGLPSGSSGLSATIAWYDLNSELEDRIKTLRLQQGNMEVRVQGKCRNFNMDRQTALKKELRSSYNVDSKYTKNILRQQSDLEKALLSQGVNVADFDDTLPNTTVLVTAQSYRDLYNQIAYIYNDFDLALKIMKNRILDQHGGLMIDTAVTPEINTDIFDGSSSLNYQQLIDDLKQRHSITAPSGASPLPDPDSIIRNHVHQAFIRKLGIDPGRSSRWFNTPYRNYLATLKRSGFEELAKAIKEVTKKNSPELFYKGLGGALPTHGADLSMVDNSRGLNASPPIIAARQNALALKKTIDFFAQIYSTFKHNSSGGQIKRDLPKLATSLTTHTLKNLPAPKRTARIKQIKMVVNQLPYRGIYFSTDNLGYLMGREAMVMMNTVTPPLDVEYSYHADGGRSIQGVDLAAETYLTKTDQYDNRVIVTLSEDSDIWRGDAELYHRHPRNTYWAFWDRHQKLLLTQAGQPLPLTESSKLVLSGHGDSTGLENHSPDEVADIVSKLLPAGGQIKKINLLCCKLDQIFINVDPGPNLASQQWLSKTFSGRLLESLATKQNAITVGSVTFFNKLSSTSTFLGKSFTYPFGQTEPPLAINPLTAYYEEQSHQISLRKPEATVVEMQRAADGTFTARTKNGVPLFDDYVEKKKLIRVTPANPHPGNLASPSAILSISQATNLLPYIKHGNVIAPADLNIILFIFNRNISFSNKVIAVDSGPKAEGLAFTLKAAKEARNYDQWMAKISEYYPNENTFFSMMLAMEYINNSERDSKFAKLQGLVRDDKIVVITADLPNELDLVTGQYDRKNIAYSLIPLPYSCNIASSRRRRSVSTSNCNWDFDKATDQLKLVAGDRIDFLLPDGTAKEIGLFKPQNRKLAGLQTAIQEYRRRTAIANLVNRFGQYAIIALDRASFTAAKDMAIKLRGLLDRYSTTVFRFRPNKSVLISPDGRVVPLVGGGSTSRISLVGSPASFSAGLGAKCLETVVNGGRVGQLDVLVNTPAGSKREALSKVLPDTQLKALSAASDWLTVDTLSAAALSPVKGHTTFNTHSWQGHSKAFRQQLHDNTASALPSGSKQVSVDIDKKLEFTRIARDFSTWVDSTLKSESSLNANYFPLLHTLTKTEDGQWHMDFIHKDTKDRQNLRITDKAPLRLKAYFEQESPGPGQKNHGLRHSIKKALFKPTRASGFANEALSGIDHFQTLMSIIRRGSLLVAVSRTDDMSDGFYRSMVIETYVYLGMEISQGVELVDELARLLKDHTRIGKMLPAETKVVKTFTKTGGSTRALTTTTRLTRFGKFMKPVKALGKAAGPLGLGLMGASFGLSVYQYTQVEDKTLKDLHQDKMIVQGVMLGVAAFSAKIGGPVGVVLAAAMVLGMFIAESFFGAKAKRIMKEKILVQKLKHATKVVEAFNDLYQQLDPKIYFPKDDEVEAKERAAVRKLLSTRKNDLSLSWVQKELKIAFKSVDQRTVKRIFEKMAILLNITDDAKFSKKMKSFLKDEERILDKRYQTVDFYSTPAASNTTDRKLFDLGLEYLNLMNPSLKYGRLLFKDHLFEMWPEEEEASLKESGTYTDGVFEYVKNDCKAGKRLAAYRCTDGTFDIKSLMPDKVSTIIMPVRMDWTYKGKYTSFDDGRTVEPSDGRRFFDAFAHARTKIKYYRSASYRGPSGFGWETTIYVKKGYIIEQFDRIDSSHTDVTLQLDYRDLTLIFPPKIQQPSRSDRGLSYHIDVPENSTNTYKLIIKDDGCDITIRGLEKALSANFYLYYHGEKKFKCLNKYYWLGHGENCGVGEGNWGYNFKLGGGRVYFRYLLHPDREDLREIRRKIKIFVVDDSGTHFIFRYYRRDTQYVEVQSFHSKEPLYNSAARRKYYSEINAAHSNRPRYKDIGISRNPTPKPKIGRRYKFPGQFVPVILEELSCVWYDRTNDVEIRFIRSEGSQPEHIIPVMGTPNNGYYFYDRNSQLIYLDKQAVLTEQRLNDYKKKKHSRSGLFWPFYDTAHAFPYTVVSYHIIDSPEEPTEKKLVVITKNGAAFALHGLSGPALEPEHRYTCLYISATESSLQEALGEVGGADNRVKNILPVSIVKEAHSNQLLKSGFYHGQFNLVTAYLDSAVDFYGVNESRARCLTDSDGKNDCFVNPRGSKTNLKMTPELSRSIKNDHLPVHRFFEGNGIYYLMRSSLTEDIYYIRFSKGATDSEKLAEVNQLNVLTFGNKRKDAGGFTDVRSLKNGILAYTRNGYILMIPNSTLLNRQRLASSPRDTYRHSGWYYSSSDGKKSQFLQPENSTTNVIYYQLPNDSSIDLVGLDMGRLLSGLVASHFSGDNGTSVEHWDQQRVSTFLAGLKAAIRTVYQQFKADFEEDAPDLIKLPLVHTPKNASLPEFFKQLDFWYMNSQDRLFAANANDEFRIVGSDAQSLMALKGEGESKPYRFFVNPETVSTSASHPTSAAPTTSSTTQKATHPYCQNHQVVSNQLPNVFRSDISVPCEYSDDSPTADYVWDRSEIQWEGRSSEGVVFTLAEGRKTLSGLDLISGLREGRQRMFYTSLFLGETSSGAYYKEFRSGETAHILRVNLHFQPFEEESYWTINNDYASNLPVNFEQLRSGLAGKIVEFRLNSADSPYYQYRKQALLPIDFAPASLKGRQFRNAWYDIQKQELILGPTTHKLSELSLIGRIHINNQRKNTKYFLCFDNERKRAYYLNQSDASAQFRNLSNIETDDNGRSIQIFGTTGNNTLNASDFLMETLYYDEGKYARSLSLTPESPHDLTLYLDGKGGADTFAVKNSDLAYFAQIIIKLEEGAATDHATDPDSSNPSYIRIDTPAYRNTFLRDDRDLLIADRFNPKGVVRIKQVWTAPFAPSIKPALIEFSHSQFQLDQLRELITVNQGIYLPPLRAGSEPLPSVPVPASKDRPLLIDLAPGTQLIPKLNTDGIKLTILPHNGAMDGTGAASLTVPNYRFAQGSVQVRQLSNDTQASASGYFHLGFDDPRDCHNCLSPFRSTNQTVSVAGRDFYVQKMNQSNKINYLASWNNTIGYPVMGQKMLDAFSNTPNTESPYPTLVMDRPAPSELQPTCSVFYDVDINALHFEFEQAPHTLAVNVWRGQTLVRKVRMNRNGYASLNVLLVDNKPTSGRPGRYKVFPFALSSLKLVARGNDWVLQSEGYQYPMGTIADLGLPFFERLWPSVLHSLLKTLPYDGLVFTGEESNEHITTSDLAARLEPSLPRLFDSSKQAPGNTLITGNSLNNIVYIAPEMDICNVLGHSGHDLMLLGDSNKKANNPCKLNLNGGDGDDIYDLRSSSRQVRVTDQQGRHTVILSSKSRADLKSLFGDKSLRLHITDLEPDQIEIRLQPDSLALSKDSSSEASSSSTTSDLPAHLIVTLLHNQVVLTKLPLSALDSLYFKGRKHTSNPAQWIKDRSQPLQQDSINQQFALTSPEGVIISGKQLASDLKPVNGTDPASSLAQTSLPPENHGSARIDLHFQQLVQSLASFNASAAANSIPVTDRPLVAGLNVTSPLSNNTRPVLQGGAG